MIKENFSGKRIKIVRGFPGPALILYKDGVRGKYIASRLLWDLGLLESFAEDLLREDERDSV